MIDFVDLVSKDIKSFSDNMNQSKFDTVKAQQKEQFFNRLLGSNHLNIAYLIDIISSDYYHDLELYKEIDGITFENLQKFVAKYFSQMKLKVLVQGNMTKDQALNVANIIKTNFAFEPLETEHELKGRSYQMPLGTHVFRARSLMPNDDKSKIRNYYEIGPETLRNQTLAVMLESILEPKAYDFLRTKEQLGYRVGCDSVNIDGVIGIVIHVSSQEHKHPYREVLEKMETFMSEVAKATIDELTDDEFESFKQTRVKALLADEKRLSLEHRINWTEIKENEYIFNRTELAAKVTKSLTKSDLQEFFSSFTKPENMRKLSVQVIGNEVVEGNSQEIDPKRELKVIIMSDKLAEDEQHVGEDIKEFQKSLVLHPIVKFEVE
jgi:nardilysin